MSDTLTLEDLAVRYGPDAPVVRGVSFTLEPGATLGLIGESGSGKSTVVNAILGMLADNARASGAVRFGEQDLLRLDARRLRHLRGRRIAAIPQAALGALNPMLRVGDQLAELAQLYRGIGRREAWRRSVDLLEAVGLPEPDRRMRAYPHQLSGGQSQRVLIGMALAGDPRLVLADEPTTALDVTVQRRILDLLLRLQREREFSLIFVTHHLALLPGLADRLAVMREGRVIETGETAAVIADPQAPYTRTLLSVAREAEQAQAAAPAGAAPDPPAALAVCDLTVSYPDGPLWRRRARMVLGGVSFAVPPGTCLGIVGESGSGKSTLLRALMGLATYTGTVSLGAEAVPAGAAGARRLRRELHLVFQDSAGVLNPALTVRDILAEPLRAQKRPVAEADLARALADVNLPCAYLDRYPTDLSGGQRQRVAIARGLVAQPRVLLLDESLSALDVSTQSDMILLLTRLRRETGLTTVMVSHDFDVVRALADQLLVLHHGEVVEQGATGAVFRAPRQPYTRQLIAAVPRIYGAGTAPAKPVR